MEKNTYKLKHNILLTEQVACVHGECEQESPAIADKPMRRESLPKMLPSRRAYLVTNSNFGRICYRFRDIDA